MNEDDDLKILFADLEGAERQAAPEFGAVWEGARVRLGRRRRRQFLWRAGAVAAGVVLLGLMTGLWEDRPAAPAAVSHRQSAIGDRQSQIANRKSAIENPPLPWRTALLLSEWRAPTDFLLAPLERPESKQ